MLPAVAAIAAGETSSLVAFDPMEVSPSAITVADDNVVVVATVVVAPPEALLDELGTTTGSFCSLTSVDTVAVVLANMVGTGVAVFVVRRNEAAAAKREHI